ITTTTLNAIRRDEPYHGSTPHWRANLFTEKVRWIAVNARFTHSDGNRNFVFDELAGGALRNSPRNVQTLVFGDGRRPVTTANLTLSIFPLQGLVLTNHTAYNQTKMEGDNSLRTLTNGTLDSTAVNFQFLGI